MKKQSTSDVPEATVQELPNTICELAAIISDNWKEVNDFAKPYLQAMYSLRTGKDTYICDDAYSIVKCFIGNARSWTGPLARSVKAKLNELIR